MEPTLTKQAHKELEEILQRQFCGTSDGYPSELVEDLGITLLNLTAIGLKRQIRINKQKNTL